jgi:hypothetical protein
VRTSVPTWPKSSTAACVSNAVRMISPSVYQLGGSYRFLGAPLPAQVMVASQVAVVIFTKGPGT